MDRVHPGPSRPFDVDLDVIDDVEVNSQAARRSGMTAVHFRDNEQAVAEIRDVLA